MKQEINPQETNRAQAFELWMKSPMPMVTLTKTFDVTRLYKVSRRKGLKFNAVLCWCIGKAASQMEEFYLLPEHGNLYKYDRLAINVIVNNKVGGINSCDIPYTDDFEQFNAEYLTLTQSVSLSCNSTFDWFKVTLPISFQFHHVQMDGGHGARFLDELQKTIKVFEYDNNIEYD